MACTGKKRFDYFKKQIGTEMESLSGDQLIEIKEKLSKRYQPHLHEDKYPSNYQYEPEELGLHEVYPSGSKQSNNGKIKTFRNALEKLRKGEKLNKNQSTIYNQIATWLHENLNKDGNTNTDDIYLSGSGGLETVPKLLSGNHLKAYVLADAYLTYSEPVDDVNLDTFKLLDNAKSEEEVDSIYNKIVDATKKDSKHGKDIGLALKSALEEDANKKILEKFNKLLNTEVAFFDINIDDIVIINDELYTVIDDATKTYDNNNDKFFYIELENNKTGDTKTITYNEMSTDEYATVSVVKEGFTKDEDSSVGQNSTSNQKSKEDIKTEYQKINELALKEQERIREKREKVRQLTANDELLYGDQKIINGMHMREWGLSNVSKTLKEFDLNGVKKNLSAIRRLLSSSEDFSALRIPENTASIDISSMSKKEIADMINKDAINRGKYLVNKYNEISAEIKKRYREKLILDESLGLQKKVLLKIQNNFTELESNLKKETDIEVKIDIEEAIANTRNTIKEMFKSIRDQKLPKSVMPINETPTEPIEQPSISLSKKMFDSLVDRFGLSTALKELNSIRFNMIDAEVMDYNVDISKVDMLDDPLQYHYVSSQIRLLDTGSTSGEAFIKYDTLLTDGDKNDMAKIYDELKAVHYSMTEANIPGKSYKEIIEQAIKYKKKLDKQELLKKKAVEIFAKYDKDGLISSSAKRTKNDKASKNHLERMVALADEEINRKSEYKIEIKNGVKINFEVDNLTGEIEILNKKDLSDAGHNDKSRVYSYINDFLLDNTDFYGIKKDTKGSSTNPDKSIPETKIMKKVLTNGNIRETFMDLLMNHDIANGKKIHGTKEFNDHLENVFSTMEDFMEKTGATHEFQMHTTSGSTAGKNMQVYDAKDGLDKDRIRLFYNKNDPTANASEIFMHEALHSFFKRALESSPKLRLRMKMLQNQARKNIDVDVFTKQALAEGREGFTPEEAQNIRDKYEYILGKNADVEEFMAYAMSNSFLFDEVSKLEIEPQDKQTIASIFNQFNEVSELDGPMSKSFRAISTIMDLIGFAFKSLFNAIGNIGKEKTTGKLGLDMMNDTIADIHKFKLKMEHKNDPDSFQDILKNYSERIESPLLAGSIETTASFLGAMKNIGIKVNAPIKVATDKIFELKDKALDKIDSSNNEMVAAAIEGVSNTKLGEKVLNSRLLKSIMYQNFSSGKYDDLEEMHRKKKQALDALMTNVKASIEERLSGSILASNDFIYHSHIFTNKILKSGINNYVSELDFDTYDTIDQSKAIVAKLRAEMTMKGVTIEQFAHLDALARHTVDGKVHIGAQQINAQNILNNYFIPAHSRYERDVALSNEEVSIAEKYIAFKSLESLSEQDISIFEDMYTTPEVKSELDAITKLYNKNYNEVKYSVEAKQYNPLPLGYTATSLSKAKYNISVVHESELDTFESSVSDSEVLEKFTLMGETLYRVKHVEDSLPYEDGVLGSISLKKQGSSLKSVFEMIFREKVRKKLPEVKNKNMNQYVRTALNSMWNKNNSSVFVSDSLGVMPMYDASGNVNDLLIPFSNEDIVTMEATTDMMTTLPHSMTRIIDYKNSEKNNMGAIDKMNAFYKDKKYDDIDFVLVSKVSNKDLWDKLTPASKKYIEDIHKGKLYVPDEVLELMLGSRQSSISNLKVNDVLPTSENDDHLMPYKVRKYIGFAEKIWGEILGKNKTVAILFNPDISIGNMISNMMLMWTHGVPPQKYLSEFYNNWKLLEEYEALKHEQIKLSVRKTTGEDIGTKLTNVTNQLKAHKFDALIKDGQFTAMMEDMSNEPEGYIDEMISDHTLKDERDRDFYHKAIVEAYRRKAEDKAYFNDDIEEIALTVMYELNKDGSKFKVPSELAKIRKTLYGSKGTEAHRIATKIVMYSDTLSRQMLYDKMKKDKLNKNGSFTVKDNQELMNFIDEQFINYGYNVSGGQMWIEKVFGIHFLKYLFRHHKAYTKVLRRSPTGVIAQQATQHAVGINIADPMDTLADHNPFENIVNRWRSADPLSSVADLVTQNITMPISLFDIDSYYKVYH